VPPLDLIRDTFEATARANVRSGPGREYAVVEVLASGERVQVIGRIEDADWYVIARNGVASGFVASSLLRPAREPASTAVASSPPPGAERVEVEAVRTCRVLVQRCSSPTAVRSKSTSRSVRARTVGKSARS